MRHDQSQQTSLILFLMSAWNYLEITNKHPITANFILLRCLKKFAVYCFLPRKNINNQIKAQSWREFKTNFVTFSLQWLHRKIVMMISLCSKCPSEIRCDLLKKFHSCKNIQSLFKKEINQIIKYSVDFFSHARASNISSHLMMSEIIENCEK